MLTAFKSVKHGQPVTELLSDELRHYINVRPLLTLMQKGRRPLVHGAALVNEATND
jgi:hypothetical protein